MRSLLYLVIQVKKDANAVSHGNLRAFVSARDCENFHRRLTDLPRIFQAGEPSLPSFQIIFPPFCSENESKKVLNDQDFCFTVRFGR